MGLTLADLLEGRRDELMQRWRARVNKKLGTESLEPSELDDDMPRFVAELANTLRASGAEAADPQTPSAADHGADRLRIGFNVDQVVREYGILHLAIVDLADEASVPILPRENRALIRCVSAGVATALAEYQRRRDLEVERQESEHLAFIAHELRNPLYTARLGLSNLRRKQASPLSERIDRALGRIQDLIDQTLTESRLKQTAQLRLERIVVADLLAELKLESEGDAEDRGVTIELETDDAAKTDVEADSRLLRSAVSNIMRNAVKFTAAGGTVVVRCRVIVGGFIAVDVEDECGGLPDGKIEELFRPFVQAGKDRSGFGLGLAIARQAIEAHNGTIHVRTLPGKGCVFTIELPLVDDLEAAHGPG